MNLKMNNRRTTALYYAGALGTCYATSTSWDMGWALIALVVHVVVVSLFSAVVHRYFCHRSFDASPILMWLLSFVPVAYGYATPAGWAPLHSAHHALADTDGDTHLKGWAGLLTANYRMPPLRFALAGKWFHGARHAFLHNNALGVVVLWQSLLWLASPQAFLWAGMVPLFTLHFCNGLHRVFSHKGTQAHNRWYLEYLCPMGGEWIHDEHHVNARNSNFASHWYELDTGAAFVRLLRTTA